MHLSPHAQSLLDGGDIRALQALSYEELLPKIVREEILASFLNPRRAVLAGDSSPEVLQDPTSYETLMEACVLSSGQIFSKSTVEVYLASHRGKVTTCPMTRKTLTLNIARTGLPYVLLPKIDEVIRGFKTLYSHSIPEEKRLHSYAPKRETAAKEESLLHSAMAALHFTPRALAKKEAIPTAPPLALAYDIQVATFELKVAKNKVRIVIKCDLSYGNVFSDQLEHYFETLLPCSKVDLSCGSYSMSQESFGRCWKKLSNQHFELDLWFPPYHSSSTKRTFSDHHLLRLLAIFSTTLAIPENIETGASPLPTYMISDIAPKTYIVALPSTPVTFEQLKTCCHTFLESTQRIAEQLHHNINDRVIVHDHSVSASKTSGLGMFGSEQVTTLTSSSVPGSQFTQRK